MSSKGSAAVAALVSLAVLVVLGVAGAVMMQTETAATKNFCEGIAAQAIAEAGLRRAIVVLYKNGEPNGLSESLVRETFAGSYRIASLPEGTRLRVRSVGTVGDARRTASVLVTVEWKETGGQLNRQIQIVSYSN